MEIYYNPLLLVGKQHELLERMMGQQFASALVEKEILHMVSSGHMCYINYLL